MKPFTRRSLLKAFRDRGEAMGSRISLLCVFVALIVVGGASTQVASDPIQPIPVPLPGGSGGIGFDHLDYSAQLGLVLVPAGRSGNLDLIDPKTLAITSISGFSAQAGFGGGHGDGTTSVDSGRGWLFAIDRSRKQVDV